MNSISEAIVSRVNDGSAESNALLNIINSFTYRKSTSQAPYVVFFLVNDNRLTTNTTQEEDTLYQFSIYSDSDFEAGDIADKLFDVFDDYYLNVDGYNFVMMSRDGYRTLYDDSDEKVHHVIEYRFEVQKGR